MRMQIVQSKYTGWIVHGMVWAVVFGMPLFVTSPNRPQISGMEYLRFLLVPLSFMVVFYTNYFLLIERHLFKRQIGRFLFGNLLFIIGKTKCTIFQNEMYNLRRFLPFTNAAFNHDLISD